MPLIRAYKGGKVSVGVAASVGVSVGAKVSVARPTTGCTSVAGLVLLASDNVWVGSVVGWELALLRIEVPAANALPTETTVGGSAPLTRSAPREAEGSFGAE